MSEVVSNPTRFLLRRDRAVQAGAGTGKTHALVTQYLHLCAGLSAHGRALLPRQIVAMTFTEKAAGEMLERLRQRVSQLGRLGRAVQDGIPDADQALAAAEPDLLRSAQLLGTSLPGPDLFEKVLVLLGGAPVGTFHSFAGGLLRRHAAAAGVDPDFVLLDEETARDMEQDATERVILLALEGGLSEGSLPLLAEGEAVASGAAHPVSAEEAARLVSEYGFRGVGAGRGVVEALCEVRRRRAEEGLSPAGLAAAYDDEKMEPGFVAAREAFVGALGRLSALAPLLGGKSIELARELGGEAVGLCADLRMLDGLAASLPRCEQICERLGRLRGKAGDEDGRGALADAKADVREALVQLQAVQYTAAAAPLARAFERLLHASWAAYDEAKRRTFGLDFTDLLYRARDLLRDHAQVRETVQARFTAVLVDEFQDTNPLQGELLALVDGAPATRRDGPGKLYIVGDRKQSIYEFRGADVATFTALRDQIVAAGGDEETLTVSRRSLPGVLSLVNALFAQVMQPAKGRTGDPDGAPGPDWRVTWDPARDPLLPLRQDDPQAPATVGAELLRPAVPEDADPDEVPVDGDPIGTEASLVARHILLLHRAGRRFGDVAVLLRRFTHLDRYLLSLRRAGIPHYVVKGRGFYDAQEIRDLCAALTLIDDPEDLMALVSVLRAPLCGLCDDSLVRLHLSGHLSLPGLLYALPPDLPEGEGDRLRNLLRLLSALLLRGDRLGPAACLRALCDGTDLPAVLAAGPEGEQRVANLEMLLSRAQRFEEGGGGLRAFVRWLRLSCDPNLGGDVLAPQAQIVDERDDVVRVMTVHQSKGLEFPVVLVPGCAARERGDHAAISYDREVGLSLCLFKGGERNDTLPSLAVARLRRLRGEAESARLFYVAATRARDCVVFAGEARRASYRATWRGHLEALLSSTEGLLKPVDIDLCLGPDFAAKEIESPPPSDPQSAHALALSAAQAVARAYHDPLSPASGPLRLSVSAACDLAVCRARFHHLHALRLEERLAPGEPPARARASDENLAVPAPGEGSLSRGGPNGRLLLSHRLLARADLLARGSDLEGLLLADGHDPAHPAVAEVRTRVARLLQGRMAQQVSAVMSSGGTVRRALPFVLPLPHAEGGVSVRLRGQIDLLLIDREAPQAPRLVDREAPQAPRLVDREAPQAPRLVDRDEVSEGVTLIDYHYSYAPPDEDGPLQTLRRGLLGHVGRALLPGARIRVGFAYLREPDPAPRLRDSLPAEEAAALHVLAAAAPGALLDPGDVLCTPPLPRERCAALSCGYRYRCHGEPVTDA